MKTLFRLVLLGIILLSITSGFAQGEWKIPIAMISLSVIGLIATSTGKRAGRHTSKADGSTVYVAPAVFTSNSSSDGGGGGADGGC